jgi:polyferredoxin
MKEQSFTNHTQIVYRYYIFTGLPILILAGLGIAKLFTRSEQNAGIIILLTSWILLTMLFRSRGFALKAQDRAIRAEESLRYFILTGKRLNQGITMQQIIALRFASDEEFPTLAERAATEQLSNKEIKKAIRKWRSDHYRV